MGKLPTGDALEQRARQPGVDIEGELITQSAIGRHARGSRPFFGRQPGMRKTYDQRRTTALRDHFRRDPLRHEGFDHISDLDVAVIRNGDAALHAVPNFGSVFFEAAQRSDFALEDHNIVA